MATLSDYPINFPYGATTAPYSSASPHKGSDRAAPTGTAVVVAGVTIGKVGSTGLATGPHTHLQCGRDEWAQSPINPDPYWFKPGTVVKTGSASQWGQYVCVRVGDVNCFYCHLSEINVNVGQNLKEEEMPNDGDIINAKRSATQVKDYQPTGEEFEFYKKNGFRKLMYDTIDGMQVEIDNRNKAIQDILADSDIAAKDKIKKIKEILNV